MACCDEYGCHRQTPIGLYRGDFGGQVYAVTRSRLVADHGNGRVTLSADGRHDVTAAMRRFLCDNADWVRSVLADVEAQP